MKWILLDGMLLVVAFGIGYCYGIFTDDNEWKTDAIKHGYAHYNITNSLTGQSEWIWNSGDRAWWNK